MRLSTELEQYVQLGYLEFQDRRDLPSRLAMGVNPAHFFTRVIPDLYNRGEDARHGNVSDVPLELRDYTIPGLGSQPRLNVQVSEDVTEPV